MAFLLSHWLDVLTVLYGTSPKIIAAWCPFLKIRQQFDRAYNLVYYTTTTTSLIAPLPNMQSTDALGSFNQDVFSQYTDYAQYSQDRNTEGKTDLLHYDIAAKLVALESAWHITTFLEKLQPQKTKERQLSPRDDQCHPFPQLTLFPDEGPGQFNRRITRYIARMEEGRNTTIKKIKSGDFDGLITDLGFIDAKTTEEDTTRRISELGVNHFANLDKIGINALMKFKDNNVMRERAASAAFARRYGELPPEGTFEKAHSNKRGPTTGWEDAYEPLAKKNDQQIKVS